MKKLEKLISLTVLQQQANAFLKAWLVSGGVFFFLLSFKVNVLLCVAISGLTLIVFAWYSGMFQRDRNKAKNYLHRRFPELEFSLDILEKEELNLAEKLQLERLKSQFRYTSTPLLLGRNLLPALLFLVVSSGIFGMSNLIVIDSSAPSKEIKKSGQASYKTIEGMEVRFSQNTIKITPPAYTGLATSSQEELDIKAIEGSLLEWSLGFNSESVEKVQLVEASGLQVPFEKNEEEFYLKDRLEASGIYAVQAFGKDTLLFESDYYRLEMIRDRAPLIIPEEKDLYVYHFHKDPQTRNLSASISDDFKVRQVYIVATLARGTGENVKFRENRIELPKRDFKEETLQHTLDLESMDFQPGDELYYYWLAIDNKRPEPNISKSDTYFIQFVDSTGLNDSQLEAMAIHVLPDYFRSQRQIIIDTEKLLEEKRNLTQREFDGQSNELGYEQKLLRMRYGQYLGEEFESNAPGGSLNSAEGKSILESFIHNHDHEGENEGAPSLSKFRYAALENYRENHDKNQEILKQQLDELGGHDHDHHDHDHDEDDELAGLLEEYLHNHDSEEMNTLYEQSTRSILKMALEQMWQSELHLRLFEPEKALPYQHKALEYLKSVQQKSRTYVKKSGFEPVPIKEAEKRMTGNTDGVDVILSKAIAITPNEMAVMAGRILGMFNQEALTEIDKQLLDQFGQLWTLRLAHTKMEDWSTLLLLQKLRQENLTDADKSELRKKLQSLVNLERRSASTRGGNERLAKSFWENYR
ncbi:hypothetical protein [Arthrospiribacter ruber]|uniref:Tryptophan-rich sensory protein n=1 Tax=Arthrospiribacter ruber TaxID=2487934 RepID=A0A951IRX5_9BACT|nr:hypothetical protein [Arthrospiribacter ruber]MBW3466790.1 hypothetical protein [Arthrospiribacter ruber]